MKTQFLAASLVVVLLSMWFCGAARADALAGFSDITVTGGAIVSLRYGGTEYVVANGDLMLGTTTRWYIPAATGVATLWVVGGATPGATVPNASDPKSGDTGPKGDNFLFTLNGTTDISSIDGINFQETVFPVPTKTIFVFERGGNDTGTFQAILQDGSLGTPVSFSGTNPYKNTGVGVNGQNAFGVVFTTDVPVKGVRITAGGHDTLSICALPVQLDPRQSHEPQPEDKATDVPSDVVLSWTPGEDVAAVNGHIVYLSENFNDVDGGIGGATLSAGSYEPGRLDFGTTYYWRVDEVGASPGSTVFKGEVWSFTVEPYSYPLKNVKATASGAQPDMGPENTVNGSGLNADDGHSTDGRQMWLSAGAQPNWILFEFDDVYKLDEMWVWNSNQLVEKIVGFGAKDVTIEYSTDGSAWAELANVPPFEQADGADGYVPDTPIDLGGALAKYIRLTINSTWGGIAQSGLSEVRFFYIPVRAREPVPADDSTGQELDVALNWRPGREAVSHQVYVGSDRDAVASGTVPVKNVSQHSLDLTGLTFGTAYYWKVNEVNDVASPSLWEGDVWAFTTKEYQVVDDFEIYTNESPNRVFQTWIDGWGFSADEFYPQGNPGNGSAATIGYDPLAGDIMEKTIFHGGTQSMPFDYNNALPPNYAETERTWDTPQNWTVGGADVLLLYVRGRAPAFAVQASGSILMGAGGADIWNSADEFRFAWKRLTGNGTIIARVESVERSSDWAKAGVMIRESLDPGSRFAAVYITPDYGCRFQARSTTSTAATSDSSVVTPAQTAIKAPYWVKLERTGNDFKGYYSANGTTWTPMAWNPQTIAMTGDVYVGLALTSHNAAAQTVAEFSGVAASGGVAAAQWLVATIGVAQPSNDAGQLYVKLQDSANRSKVVNHPDPLATVAVSWQPWAIPLSQFTGVDLTKVKKIIIGVSDADKRAAGRLYIDDIGFGRPLPVVAP